ncbi:plasmid partitioning protein RepB C-terminal domain-containing protein [Sphingomonas lycopersici]|uniref:plasmid partitioning protein RepB C-terminal domain-containing protein n=1 Tax=Sphingomonas lycopersici TaxID=2951807 RepID=UPI0022383B5A|nr:plasmid partitioning protein RepB C-terminal domain-containing protein [Sphingomonas lycopersici]
MEKIRIAFQPEVFTVRLDDILPLRKMTRAIAVSRKYGRIKSSINTVGLIEPLAVAPQESDGKRMLLDGHLRYHALRECGVMETKCIVADDDDSFTYNKRVNRLSTVQEHYMIRRAIERGVPEEKIATALGMQMSALNRRKGLLSGIAPEVAELLQDRNINTVTFDILRKMKFLRQVEAAELMISVNNFSLSYAKAILAATKQSDLAKPDQPKKILGMTSEQMAKMERELDKLNRDFKAVEDTYGDDVLHLVMASRYLSRLVENENVHEYLDKRHPEMLVEFQTIIGATSLDQMGPADMFPR